MAVLIAVHVLAAVIWVGGMFFAYMCLRPSVAALAPQQRCALWEAVFSRFFPAVWVSVLVLLASGYGMIFAVYGGMGGVGLHVHLMQGLGWLMIGLFGHLYFAPFAALRRAVKAGDWPDAGAQIGRIRPVVAINLVLGLTVVAIAVSGRWV